MTIRVFASEIRDGIDDIILNKNTFSCASNIKQHTPNDKEIAQAQYDFEAFIGKVWSQESQPDLYYMDSILVTTGWNKNDDVFHQGETWAARNSPENKQLNYQHDESDIIGHITSNYAVDLNGKSIASSTEANELPDDFEIRTASVLYRSWGDAHLKDRMDKIIADIEEDKWFVSMECLFAGFDYAVIDEDNKHSIVTRDETSAFLSKHLRAYGGTGTFEGRKIGRLLRNIVFSGHGIVLEPANPRSVVLRDKSFKSTLGSVKIESADKREKTDMADDLSKLTSEVNQLKADLSASLKLNQEISDQLKAVDTEAAAANLKKLEDKLEAQKTVTAELQSKFDELVSEKEAVDADLKAKAKELKESSDKLETLAAQAKLDKRTFSLKEKGLSDDDVASHIEKFADASDEMFDNIVAMIPKPKADDKSESNKDDKDDKKKMDKKKDDKSDADSKDALDDVNSDDKSTAKLVDDDSDDTDGPRKSMSQWLGKAVLRSTANLKEYTDKV